MMKECGERIRKERASVPSPRLALRRVLVLAEGRQFREAAAVLGRLGVAALTVVVAELPLELLIEGLPHSAQLLETLFTKLIAANQRSNINIDPVLWQLVRLLASHEDIGLKRKIKSLAQVLIEFKPDVYRLLMTKRNDLEQAVQGLGCHGLTTDGDGLTHLHAALKTELQNHIETYKNALHCLDDLHLVSNDTKKPIYSSHQRLLSLRFDDIQQRLIDNTTLFTTLNRPILKQLKPLVEMLGVRVQNDKEALFSISQLKRLQPIDDDKPVAAFLMSFSKGCAALMELMQVTQSPCHSEGYYSESEQEIEKGSNVVSRYAALYYQSRPRALEALDSLPDFIHATQLKSKIIFSVVVLAFRTCRNLRESKLREILLVLHVDMGVAAGLRLRQEAERCLASTASTFPLEAAEGQVLGLVCDALKEYHCLEKCKPLRRYVNHAVRVCWELVTHDPPFDLDTDFHTPIRLEPERHLRHHSSDKSSDIVRSYLWPALIINSSYVHKAVVVTNGT